LKALLVRARGPKLANKKLKILSLIIFSAAPSIFIHIYIRMIDQPQILQEPLQWCVTWYDGDRIIKDRFIDAWCYSMPQPNSGWTYLPKASALQRFATGEQNIPVAWKNNRAIYLEWL
jgi:hypothetical protein